MSMIKYGTYRVFQSKKTKEIKRIPIDSDEVESLEKNGEWTEKENDTNEQSKS
jgi:hypothetical protein